METAHETDKKARTFKHREWHRQTTWGSQGLTSRSSECDKPHKEFCKKKKPFSILDTEGDKIYLSHWLYQIRIWNSVCIIWTFFKPHEVQGCKVSFHSHPKMSKEVEFFVILVMLHHALPPKNSSFSVSTGAEKLTMELDTAVAHYKSVAFATSTKRNYNSYFRSYQQFCQQKGCCFPLYLLHRSHDMLRTSQSSACVPPRICILIRWLWSSGNGEQIHGD